MHNYKLIGLMILLSIKRVASEPQAIFAKIGTNYYLFADETYDWDVARSYGCQGGDLVSLTATLNSEVREFFSVSANATEGTNRAAWINGVCDESNEYCATWDSDASGFDWDVDYPLIQTYDTYIAWDKRSEKLINSNVWKISNNFLINLFVCEFNSSTFALTNANIRRINQGICFNPIGRTRTTCICDDNYEGQFCDMIINDDPCYSQPCSNGGSCVRMDINGTDSFVCNCPRLLTGKVCTEQVNECESNPCPGFARCIDGHDVYECTCEGTGYQGADCDTDIDECAAAAAVASADGESLCPNDRYVCVNTLGSYICRCRELFTGPNCAMQIATTAGVTSTSTDQPPVASTHVSVSQMVHVFRNINDT